MAIDMKQGRSFVLERGTANFWKLTLIEDGVECGGGVGAEEDYAYLQDQGEEFVNGH